MLQPTPEFSPGRPLPEAPGADLAERLRVAEAALRVCEARYRDLVDSLDHGILYHDPDGSILSANPAAERILGLRSDQLRGRTELDPRWHTVREDGSPLPREERPARLAFRTGQPVSGFIQGVVNPETGATTWLETSAVPLYRAGEREPFQVYTCFQDITARRLAEQAFSASEERFRLAMDATNDGIWDWNVDTGEVFFNPGYTRMLGWDPGEFKERVESWADLIHPADRERVLAANQACIDGASTHFEVEYRIRTRSGSWKWILGRGRRIGPEGQVRARRMVGTHVDITALKLAAKQLRDSEDKFYKAFHAAPMLVSLGRLEDGGMLEVNDQFCRLLGFTREEVVGRKSTDLGVVRPEDRPRLIAALEACGSFQNLEFTLYAKGGRAVPCLLSCEVVEVGETRMLLTMGADMTERRQTEQMQRILEAELHQNQKLESLGSLAGGVAHDMNNILAAIHAVTETLQWRHAGDPGLVQALGTIQKASTRGRDLVKSLTNFARKDLRESVLLDLNALVGEEIELLRRTTLQRVDLVLALEQPLPAVLGERGILVNAIMNLCLNAVDAMPGGGTLTLRTRRLADGQVELGVADTGEGMAPEVLARAMEPFFTTKPAGKGTGLGLAMVYATIKAHGGSVALQSEPGRGTLVLLRLPGTPAAGVPEPAPAAAPRRGSRRILLVDDDELIRASVPAMVEHFGHRVTTVAGGQEALDRLAADPAIDLVILDLNMPGMNGAETLGRLRQLRPSLPVLLATGHLDEDTAGMLRRDGHAASLAKPFTMAELDRKFQELQQA